ncbi:MAG: hypothetical protein ACOCP4_03150 [Candidatus Woesearchaeota archaeon]
MKIIKRKEFKLWFQYLSTLTAIIGLIYTIIQSNKNDSVLQAQINNLDTIAQQSILQTKKMQEQVEILKEERNFLYEQSEMKNQQRKIEIKPKLSIAIDNYDNKHIYAYLINNGEQAKIIRSVPGKDNNVGIDIPFKYIGKGEKKKVYFKLKDRENPIINFMIFFKDIEGTIYSQLIKVKDKDEIFYRGPYKNVG